MSATPYDLRTTVYRGFFKGLAQSVYGICCFFDLGSFRYDSEKGKLCKHHTDWLWIVFTTFIKLFLLWMEFPFLMMCSSLIYFFLAKDSSGMTDNITYYWVHVVSEMVMVIISTFRLLLFTHSPFYSKLFISSVNRVLKMHRRIRRIFGDKNFHLDDSLLMLFLVKVFLSLHHIAAQYRPHNKKILLVRFPTLNVMLFEIFHCSYLLYQFLLLCWQRTLISFLESYIELIRERRLPTTDYARKVIAAFDIYTQMGGIHLLVSSAWLRVSSMLFISVYYTAHESTYTFYCLFALSEIPILERAQLVLLKKLGTCLHPLFAVLLIGITSDRLKHFESQLCQRIFIIELLHSAEDHLILKQFSRLIGSKQECFLLQRLSFPLRNFIWNRGSICDRDLVFDILVYLIINATTYLQFLISDNDSHCEEVF